MPRKSLIEEFLDAGVGWLDELFGPEEQLRTSAAQPRIAPVPARLPTPTSREMADRLRQIDWYQFEKLIEALYAEKAYHDAATCSTSTPKSLRSPRAQACARNRRRSATGSSWRHLQPRLHPPSQDLCRHHLPQHPGPSRLPSPPAPVPDVAVLWWSGRRGRAPTPEDASSVAAHS
jgi:hypothetical protein